MVCAIEYLKWAKVLPTQQNMIITITHAYHCHLEERRAPRSADAARAMVMEEADRMMIMEFPAWRRTHWCNISLEQPYMGRMEVGATRLFCYSTAEPRVRSVFRLDAAAWAQRIPGRFQLLGCVLPLSPEELDRNERRLQIAMAYYYNESRRRSGLLSSVDECVLQMILGFAGL